MISLVPLLVDIYGGLLLLRWLLLVLSVGQDNVIHRWVAKLTQPLNIVFSGIIPNSAPVYLANLVPALLWFSVAIWILAPSSPIVLVLTTGLSAAVLMLTNILFLSIIASVLLSWVAPTTSLPLGRLVIDITAAISAPVRRVLPSIGGIDLSPLILLLLLNLVRRVASEYAVYQPLAWLWAWL